MEKLIIGVIASESEEYNLMKKNWEMNADNCNSDIEVYFLYGDKNLEKSYNIEKNTKNTYNFYSKCEETFNNLLYKTISFFEWVLLNKQNCMVIRSNLSTLFKLDDIFSLYKDFYKYKYFFGGTFIGETEKYNIIFSGTNLTFSIETLKLILDYKNELLKIKKNDDVVLSEFICKNYYNIHQFYNLKRLDFTDIILFQFSELQNIDDILCYRFKSNNRIKDNKLMKEILKKSFDQNFIKDKIIFDYNVCAKIYFDYEKSSGEILFYNTIIDTSIKGYVKQNKITLLNKFILKPTNLEKCRDIGLFRIVKE